MHRQVGDLVVDARGIAQRGLLVRHLILPGNLAGSQQIITFLADQISQNTYLNVMDQYRPAYRAHQYPELNRRIRASEYQIIIEWARQAGLHNLDQRQSGEFWF